MNHVSVQIQSELEEMSILQQNFYACLHDLDERMTKVEDKIDTMMYQMIFMAIVFVIMSTTWIFAYMLK